MLDETQPNGEPLLMSEDTADVDLPTVEGMCSEVLENLYSILRPCMAVD